jgi:hypothetical protein
VTLEDIDGARLDSRLGPDRKFFEVFSRIGGLPWGWGGVQASYLIEGPGRFRGALSGDTITVTLCSCCVGL